jgi:hypothetical protein
MREKPEIVAAMDARLETPLAGIHEIQSAYYAEHGRFAQLLVSHSAVPVEGVEADADRLTQKPTDESESWASLAAKQGVVLPATLPAAVEVHTYDGPHGKGFQILLHAVVEGKPWYKCMNHGPEGWREQDWKEIVREG